MLTLAVCRAPGGIIVADTLELVEPSTALLIGVQRPVAGHLPARPVVDGRAAGIVAPQASSIVVLLLLLGPVQRCRIARGCRGHAEGETGIVRAGAPAFPPDDMAQRGHHCSYLDWMDDMAGRREQGCAAKERTVCKQ